MTKDEALTLALEALEKNTKHLPVHFDCHFEAITAIREALAQPEPVKINHKHEWFRTGEMKVGQMRCISCGTWGQEEMQQRTWVELSDEERGKVYKDWRWSEGRTSNLALCKDIEAKLKEKNGL